jgi:hypothetical protein
MPVGYISRRVEWSQGIHREKIWRLIRWLPRILVAGAIAVVLGLLTLFAFA